MLSVGIIGSSGYTGKYLIKILSKHPYVEEIKYYANANAGKTLYEVHPELKNVVPNDSIYPADQLSVNHDVIFTALPHGVSIDMVKNIMNKTSLVIDLSGDFRLKNKDLYLEWYGYEHKEKYLLKNAKYSLADLNHQFDNTKLISNPGCYPTAVTLSLIPIIKAYNDRIKTISTSAYSGVSGAGKKLKEEYLFGELHDNLFAYKVNEHQHEPEILQSLKEYGFNSSYSFTAHLIPVFSGIYSTSVLFVEDDLNQTELDDLYRDFYSKSFFVRINSEPPALKNIRMTNFCDINVNVRGNRIVITSAIDNLIKGAAGQAVQNMNQYYGFTSSTGLLSF